DGLGATFTGGLLRDSEGVTWLGHDRKASLFDGVAWSVVTPEERQRSGETAMVNAACQARDGAIWLGTADGLYRYQKSRPLAHRPTLVVTAEKKYADLTQIPVLTTGRRITFDFGYIDRMTPPEKQQFRYQILDSIPTAKQLAKAGPW